MSPIVALLIIGVATAVSVAAMLLVRRRAPDGSFFADGDRAAGGFGVLATGFSVLLGLIVFLAFTSYDNSRAGAEAEAMSVRQQFELAQFLPADVRVELADDLVCYARSIVHVEWPALEAGTQEEVANPWAEPGVKLHGVFDLALRVRDLSHSGVAIGAAQPLAVDTCRDRLGVDGERDLFAACEHGREVLLAVAGQAELDFLLDRLLRRRSRGQQGDDEHARGPGRQQLSVP